FNLLAVAFLHRTAPDFHAGGQSSVLRSELVGHQQHAFQLLKAGEILVYLVYDALIARLHLGITDYLLAGRKRDVAISRPILQRRKMRRNQHGSEFMLVAKDDGFVDEGMVLE